jgi:hypothetical protein
MMLLLHVYHLLLQLQLRLRPNHDFNHLTTVTFLYPI